MRIIFRADASREIGTGHVMRSSVLAEEAISRGHECIFIGQIDGLDWVTSRISQLGFSLILDKEEDFKSVPSEDILVLDSYTIPVNHYFVSTDNWKCILKISDISTPRYISSIELIPSLFRYQELTSQSKILSGPEYILLRREIQKTTHSFSLGAAKKILVVGGGSDPFRFVSAITSELCTMEFELEIHAFTNSPIASDSASKVICHPIGRELDEWANKVDLVITTASTSSLEFIAREVPIGIVCAVENQREYYDQLGQLGYASKIGVLNALGVWEFDLQEIHSLVGDIEKRNALRKSTIGLVDLWGASRVMDVLEKP